MNQVLEAATSIYSLPSLPLKWFCSRKDRAIREKNKPEIIFFKKVTEACKIDSDTLVLMDILGLLAGRKSLPTDFGISLPRVGVKLKDILPKDENRVEFQKLSRSGIHLAELCLKEEERSLKHFLFYLLMRRDTNERLPDFFARLVQTCGFFDREVALLERKKTPAGTAHEVVSRDAREIGITKPPEARYLVSWTRYLGINLTGSDRSVLLDRRGVIDHLFHSQILALREMIENGLLVLNGGYTPFRDVRQALEKRMYILPTGLSPDDVFSILEGIQSTVTSYTLGWMIDRSYSGSPHAGNPKHARVMLNGDIPATFDRDLVEGAADSLLLMRF